MELASFHYKVVSGLFSRLHELTFAKLLAQGQLVPLYQDVLQTGQQPATDSLQQLGHPLYHWNTKKTLLATFRLRLSILIYSNEWNLSMWTCFTISLSSL